MNRIVASLDRRASTVALAAVALACLALTGCGGGGGGSASRASSSGSAAPRLVRVPASSGFDFTSAARREWIGLGQGAALADIDGDGDLDIFLPQDEGPCALFRNDGGLQFTEMASASGVQVDPIAAHAKSAAFLDYDRDGDPDLFVGTTGEGPRLFRNLGGGMFDDVSSAAGLGGLGEFTVSAVPGDFNGDGWPDLYLCNFAPVDWDVPTSPQAVAAPNRLLHNNGDGTFVDVAWSARLDDSAPSWAAQWCDIDNDGDQDLLVANDGLISISGVDTRDRVFVNEGPPGYGFHRAGASYGMDVSHFGMGFAVGDLDGDLEFDFYCTDYGANELRLSADSTPWPDRAPDLQVEAGIGADAARQFSWGAAIVDLDADGRMDLAVANGHVWASVFADASQSSMLYLARDPERGRAPPAPLDDRVFRRFGEATGLRAAKAHGARTILPADLDGDGDLDLVMSTIDGPALILENRLKGHRPWYGLRLRGTRDTLEGLGSRVELHVGETVVCDLVSAGGQPGACLAPERILYPGPAAEGEARFVVTWPDGTVQEQAALEGGWTTVVQE